MDLVLIRHPAVDVAPGICYGQTDLALRAPADANAGTPRVQAPTAASSASARRQGVTPAVAQAIASIASHLRARGPIIGCYTSPLQRCADVAHALTRSDTTDTAASTQLDAQGRDQALVQCPLVIDARLAEIDFGQWEMRRWEDIPRRQIDDWAADVLHGRPHHGESAQMVADRCASWLHDVSQEIDARFGAAHERKPEPAPCVLVIGHAGPIRLLTALALGLPPTATLQWPLDFGGVVTLRRESRPISTWPSSSAATSSSSPQSARRSDSQSARWTLRQWNG
jgi:alpha-ribazole phosphatase